ncbi:MAG: carbohydrate ABC transporter permease [Aestuariivirga sp.]|nr:carbohydrate ABC transporter permease [Aestuariivirga sp.]
MTSRPLLRLLRDAVAVLTVGCFMFPIFWWGLNSIKPVDAVFEHRGVVWFDFTPTFANYKATVLGQGPEYLAAREAMTASIIVAIGSTLLALAAGLPAAWGLSRLVSRRGRALYLWVLFQRVLPPVVIVVPLVFVYHRIGLRDTLLGVILAHGAVNLPFAVLLLKSFLDDVPREVGEAAMIDGATPWQSFRRIHLPMIRGGIAATAVLCFLFSWTEFVMALFLTSSIRLLPVQISLSVTQSWGFTSAISIAGLLPAFVFILLVQKHLVRGLTMGLEKG